MLRYRDLTLEQKGQIVNGCGGKGAWIKAPSFIFKASCNQHDFYYWRGGSETDRKIADKDFYRFMKIDIDDRDYGFFREKWYSAWAWTYFKAVRTFGKRYFKFGAMKTKEHLPF